MNYFKSWQDFMRDPINKDLKESKGIHACKQKYIQEQNKQMWHDPIIIQENGNAGISIPAAAAADGGSTSFITGNTAEVTTFTFTGAAAGENLWTASSAVNASANHDTNWYFDVEAYTGATDFSANHVNTMKVFRFFIVSGSGPLNDRNWDGTIPASIDGVVSASCTHIATDVVLAADDVNITGSILGQFVRAVKDQAATDIVCGFTNTIAPSDLFTAISGSGANGFLQITNKYRGSITPAVISDTFVAATASIATSTVGDSTYFDDQGGLVFDADVLPFSNMPMKDDGENTTSQPS